MRCVIKFADAMAKELEENSHKGGWHNCTPAQLIARLRQETTELSRAIKAHYPKEMILSEAADVANFAMMIADIYKEKKT